MSVASPRVAVAVIEELLASGVRDIVLAPGSRSAPFALALAEHPAGTILALRREFGEQGLLERARIVAGPSPAS